MANRGARYEVGYGRPPLESRFEPGLSGNPKGRPKGSISVATTLHRVLREQVEINENGRKKRVSKFDAAMKQLTRLALNGNMPAMKQVISIVSSMEQRAESEAPKEKPLGQSEKKTLQSMMKRFEAAKKGKPSEK